MSNVNLDFLSELVDENNKFGKEELGFAVDCIANHDSGTGWVERFEDKFSQIFEIDYAIACNSGTSGLHAALFAAGVGPGDEVILPSLTVIMDAYVVLHLGAIPRFADVDFETHLVTAEQIEPLINEKTKAIITVAWEGLSCDMDPIMALAKKHDLKVIDDCARSMQAYYKGRLSGTIADISVFSFEAKKHLTTGGEGGMIVTRCEELAERARKFSGLGYRHLTASAGRTHLALESVQDPHYKRFDTIGLNYRMNAISAAIGLGQLENIEKIVGMRKKSGALFLEASKGYDWFLPQRTPENYTHSYYTFSVYYDGETQKGVSWKDFYRKFRDASGVGFYGVVSLPYLEPALNGLVIGDTKMAEGITPNAERLQKKVMCFKTNYRDLDKAKHHADVLNNLLASL